MKAVRHETEEFTYSARRVYEEIVRQAEFTDSGAEMIHHALEEHLSPVYFCDFLKRYIYRKAGIELPFQEVAAETYQKIIQAEFQERHVPAAMEPNTARLNNLSRLWLNQKTVSRQVVIMLGFGLGMPLEDVNYFLQGALREGRLDPKDPMEVIAWYCFRNHLTYYHFKDFLAQYRSMKSSGNPVLDPGEATASYQVRLSGISNQDDLFRYLTFLPTHVREQSVTARQTFDRLYDRVCEMIAAEWRNAAPADRKQRPHLHESEQAVLYDADIIW